MALAVRDHDRKRRLFIARVIRIAHILRDLGIFPALLQKSHRYLRRTDARQIAPWQFLSRVF